MDHGDERIDSQRNALQDITRLPAATADSEKSCRCNKRHPVPHCRVLPPSILTWPVYFESLTTRALTAFAT